MPSSSRWRRPGPLSRDARPTSAPLPHNPPPFRSPLLPWWEKGPGDEGAKPRRTLPLVYFLPFLFFLFALLTPASGHPQPRPAHAQSELCPPYQINLPWLYRGQGLPPDPGYVPPPRPELHGPCPEASPSPPATASDEPTPTRDAGSGTPGTPTSPATTLTPEPTPGAETATPGPSPDLTATALASLTAEPSLTPTAGITGTATITSTATITPTATITATVTISPTLPPSPTATRPAGVFGIQAFESDLGPINRGQLDAIGATWVRLRALWAAIEPTEGGPRHWGMSDGMIGAAAARGLRPVVVIYTKPAWAATQSCGPVDRVPPSRYADFVQALVERYDGDGQADAPGSPVVRHWEIGNEPDLMDSQRGLEDFGSCFGDAPEAYGQELRAAWQAVRAADPQATVIFGSLAYDRFHERPEFSPPGPFRYDFLRQTILGLQAAHGQEPGFPFFDWLGFHNYNDFRNNWDGPEGADPELIGKAAHLRSEQLYLAGRYDLRDRPLLASEVGLPSGPSDEYTERSEALQAVYLGQVMLRAMAAGLEGAIWYSFSDSLPGPASESSPRCEERYFWLAHGLMRTRWMAEALARCPEPPLPGYQAATDFDPKPAYRAFQVASGLLSGARDPQRLSLAETGDAAIEAWRLRLVGGQWAIVAFSDSGERLGRRGFVAPRASLRLDASILPGWTGALRITGHMGASSEVFGSFYDLPLSQAPLFVEVLP